MLTPHGFKGGKAVLQGVVALGTGAVATQTKILFRTPYKGRVQGIKIQSQAAVTGTSITAEVFARTVAGAAGNTLQSAAADVKFASEAAAKAGIDATLTGTEANLDLSAEQLIEVVITATSITAGSGDLLVSLELAPTV